MWNTIKTSVLARSCLIPALICTVGLTVMNSEADASGMLIADGGFGGVLTIEEHSAKVTINNGIAVTEVTQVFRNTENRQVEALYLFPVPKNASVANFSMWINGKEMVGEVLEKKRAREIYNSYKRRRRDPGLLEQVDYKNFEMRIFPIGPQAEQRVQIAYYQELDYDHDWASYVYPLATAPRPGLNAKTEGKFALTMQIKSEVPLLEIESSSHPDDFVFVKHTDKYYEASLETDGGDLNRDLVLAYHASRPHTGLDLVTSKPENEDGYFQLTLTAGEELAQQDIGMDYVFVLDISGSMAHDGKLRVSRESIGAFVSELGPDDQYEVITFNMAAETLFGGLQPISPENQAEALRYLESQQGRGGTRLRPAVKAAYAYGDPDRPLNVVILSDGMTEQNEQRELLALINERPAQARVFCIGVGNEVNRPLLSQLAEGAGGLSAFLSRGDNFERQAKAFRRKLMRPAAANLKIEIDGADVYDVEPRQLPDLYHGMPLRIYGRYRNPGIAQVTVNAEINGAPLEQQVEMTFPKTDQGNPEIERMWASRKVERLLKEADRSGSRSPVIGEIVRLGETYSIVTEYTSFLVLENDAEYRRWKIDRRNLQRIRRDRRSQQQVEAELAELRERAMSELGPKLADAEKQSAQPVSRPTSSSPTRTTPSSSQPSSRPSSTPSPSPRPSRNRDISFGGGGGGAIDPITGTLGLLLAGCGFAARRRRKDEE
ncbi:MAG: VWA domain-containing protein [Planctomycetaceae bacterium]|nr:VWA domain-containing protein [Planctomycetaceae bacterium]